MYNTKTQSKLRTKTKNQKRIERLLEQYPTAVEGLNKGMLQLPNCPKEVSVSSAIINFGNDQSSNKNKVTKRELILFMIKKFNIFLDLSDENESEWVEFKFTRQNNFDSLIAFADSQEFEEKMSVITEKLRYWYGQDSDNFQGMDSAHLEESYKIPSNVIIDKDKLKKFCAEDSTTDQSSQIKKVYRAFSFFFRARFNCINATNKNRKNMIFQRNYKFGYGNSQLMENETRKRNTNPNQQKDTQSEKPISNQNQKSKKPQTTGRKIRRKRKHTRSKRKSVRQKFLDQESSISSSSGDEIERETATYPKQLRTKERRMIITQERPTLNMNTNQNAVDDYFTSPQQMQSKTDQELEGELIWLLVNLKSNYKNY
ncbi:hypothetical protein M0813_09827 [Anaeramoeba flamelloides]|uniref:Uncharacterized protein n=1 Tax=Anaeramoeba flamelloides TaxID=1746091 RepID=A0ABQ8X4K9_9EUKA|nr:hypothetical protein M0813_09827 [Anaeramoeba flamelloides]